MIRRLAAVTLLTAVVAGAPTVAMAQTPEGGGRDALPSVVRVGVAGSAEPGLSVAATGGWALTEAQEGEDGSHHRAAGTLAAGFTPLHWLSFALRLDGRYDTHPGGDDGWLGAPTLSARAGTATGALHVGAEVALTVPGEDFPSLAFDAPVVDLKALAAVDVGPATIAMHAGYRLDQSANAIEEPQRLAAGDRLVIGLSDFDALLLGLGVAYGLGDATLLGELTWDVLLGDGAPSAGRSPMRVSAGGRYRVTEGLSVELVADVSPTGRERVTPDGPLFPVEPRLGLWLGVRWDLPWSGPSPPASASRPPAVEEVADEEGEPPTEPGEEVRSVEEPEQVPAEPELPSGELRGVVRSFRGRPVRAQVTVEPTNAEAQMGSAQAETDPDGFFEVDVPPGSYEVLIEASGYQPQRRRVTVEDNGVTILNADLRRARGR